MDESKKRHLGRRRARPVIFETQERPATASHSETSTPYAELHENPHVWEERKAIEDSAVHLYRRRFRRMPSQMEAFQLSVAAQLIEIACERAILRSLPKIASAVAAEVDKLYEDADDTGVVDERDRR